LKADQISSSTAPPLSPRGANSVQHNANRHWPFRD
jgi:hypothetical protein